MSFGFQLDVAPTRGLRLIQRALVVFAATGFAFAGTLAPAGPGAALYGIGALVCLLAWHRGLRRLSWGRLTVDAGGACNWADAHQSARATGQAGAPACAARIERWRAGEMLVWMRLREPARRRARDVLLMRTAYDEEQWRRLRAWLAWLGRGPAPRD